MRYLTYTIVTAAMLVCTLFLFRDAKEPYLEIEDAQLETRDGLVRSVSLPFLSREWSRGIFRLEAEVRVSSHPYKLIRIVADDCILAVTINGKRLLLDEFSPQQRCNYRSGITVKARDLNRSKINTIEVIWDNRGGGEFGVDLGHALEPWYQITLIGLIAVLVSGVFFKALRSRGIRTDTALLLSLGLAIRLFYLSQTDFNERTYDVTEGGGHLDYIKLVATEFTLPNPSEGWEYHQPPLYYLSAALVYKLAELLDFEDGYIALQLLALCFFMVFLIASAKLLASLIDLRHIYLAALALLVFWPSGVIHSVRIGNDPLLYALWAVFLLQLREWQQTDSKRMFNWACLSIVLAILTKPNALVLTGIAAGVLLAWGRFEIRRWLTLFGATALGVVLSVVDNIYYAMISGSDWLIGQSAHTKNLALYVGNQLSNYLVFDLRVYLEQPFISTYLDATGRQYFLNFLLKSSLFAEFTFSGRFAGQLAQVVSFLLLLMVLYVVTFIVTLRLNEFRKYALVLLNLGIPLAALVFFRWYDPASPHADFRLIFPALVSVIAFFALSLESAKQNHRAVVWWLGWLIVPVFSTLGLLILVGI